MLRLGTSIPSSGPRAALPAGTPAAEELLIAGSCWRLGRPLDGYSRMRGSGLATQVAAGRCLDVLEPCSARGGRLKVRLLEDGYPCWLEQADLLGAALAAEPTPAPPARSRPDRGGAPGCAALRQPGG